MRMLRDPFHALLDGDVAEGATLAVELLAEWCPDDAATDNFEGLALDPDGSRLWIVSDDNYQPCVGCPWTRPCRRRHDPHYAH